MGTNVAEEELLSLVGDIYEAALDPSLWHSAMEKLLAATDCQGATFCILDSTESPRLPFLITVNFDPQLIKEYEEFMAPLDPTIQQIVAHPERKIFHDSTFISEREKDLHPYFDWHHRFSETRHRVAGMVTPAKGIQSGVTVHRTRQKGDFDESSMARVLMVYRHIERAVQIGFRLGTLGVLQESLLSLLDKNPLGIFLLDHTGSVILANRAGRELIDAADGIRLQKNALNLVSRSDDEVLQRLIGEALKSTRITGAMPGGAMAALRPSGRRAFSIMVSPLSQTGHALSELRPSACVVIADPAKRHAPPLERLQAVFGFTTSEARLALRLALGDDLHGAARELGIAYATARAQLSAIFRKTSTNRQGQLVRVLLTTIPSLTV